MQPQSRNLALPRGTLAPGVYVAILEVVLGQFWSQDFIVLDVDPPELQAFISGGDFLYVQHGSIEYVNASTSRDVAVELNFCKQSDSVSKWTFGLISKERSDLEVYDIVNKGLSSIPNTFAIIDGNVNILEVDTSYFPLESYGVAVFTMTNGDRSSSVFQVMKFVENVLPVSLRYVNENLLLKCC